MATDWDKNWLQTNHKKWPQLTENSHEDAVFGDLNGSSSDEVDRVENVAWVNKCVARWRVRRFELERQSSQTPFAAEHNLLLMHRTRC